MKNRITVVLISVLIALVLGELVLMLVMGEPERSEISLAYQHDNRLGWFPIPHSEATYQGTVEFQIKHNSTGFRDQEHVFSDRPRIVVLGDSFVWGYDAQQDIRFTEELRKLLPAYDIYNLGVSGYGTDQQTILFEDLGQSYEPEIVISIFCADNDRKDNSTDQRYGGYFKPYWLDGFVYDVPQSEHHYFTQHRMLGRFHLPRLIRGLNRPEPQSFDDPTCEIYEYLAGLVTGRLIVGMTGPDREIEHCLRGLGIPTVNLRRTQRFPINGSHWTPNGHKMVAEAFYRYLAVDEGSQ